MKNIFFESVKLIEIITVGEALVKVMKEKFLYLNDIFEVW